MASDFLSLIGWYFLPNIASSYLQIILYAVFIRAGDPKPTPGSPRHVRDRKRIHVFVILAYLLYTIYEADYQLRQTGDFYQILSVPHNVDDKALQSRFRKLTMQFHPDKAVGPDKAQIEAIYVHLKLARDTLIDPAKRFAYDRFGPDILRWQNCKTVRDFIFTGVRNASVYYVGTGGVLVLVSVLGYLQTGKFWRYLVTTGLFLIELHAMTRPQFPTTLSRLLNPFLLSTGLHPPILPFQMLTLLRKLAITVFIAIAQLAPILKGSGASSRSGDGISEQNLDRLALLSKTTDQEVMRLMALELTPFTTEQSSLRDLRAGLKEWLVQNTIRNDPQVKAAMETVFQRRREQGGIADAGAG